MTTATLLNGKEVVAHDSGNRYTKKYASRAAAQKAADKLSMASGEYEFRVWQAPTSRVFYIEVI